MERYQQCGVLGRGAFATVVLAKLREDEDVLRVLKEIDLQGDDQRRQEALREAELLKSLTHTNIIAYHEAFLVDGRLCIVMEYADGGDLAGSIARRRAAGRRFLEREAMAVFAQVALSLQYIHGRRILHRDLKSKNVFLTRGGLAKLGDFGISKVFDSGEAFAETQIGTPYYLPPEMCTNQPYGFPADIWCLGVVFYELLALEVPFSAPTVYALARQICNTEPQPVPASYSSETRGLLARMLSKAAKDRPSSTEILAMPHVRRSAVAFGAGSDSPVAEQIQSASQVDAVPGTPPSSMPAEVAVAPVTEAVGASALSDQDLDALLASPVSSPTGRAGLSPAGLSPAGRRMGSVPEHLPGMATTCDRLLRDLEMELEFA